MSEEEPRRCRTCAQYIYRNDEEGPWLAGGSESKLCPEVVPGVNPRREHSPSLLTPAQWARAKDPVATLAFECPPGGFREGDVLGFRSLRPSTAGMVRNYRVTNVTDGGRWVELAPVNTTFPGAEERYRERYGDRPPGETDDYPELIRMRDELASRALTHRCRFCEKEIRRSGGLWERTGDGGSFCESREAPDSGHLPHMCHCGGPEEIYGHPVGEGRYCRA